MLTLSTLSVEWWAERGVDQFIATSGEARLTGPWTNQNGGSRGDDGGATCRAGRYCSILRGDLIFIQSEVQQKLCYWSQTIIT